jgi:hypothetical protein
MNDMLNSSFTPTQTLENKNSFLPSFYKRKIQAKFDDSSPINKTIFKYKFSLTQIRFAASTDAEKLKTLGWISQPFFNFSERIKENLFSNPFISTDPNNIRKTINVLPKKLTFEDHKSPSKISTKTRIKGLFFNFSFTSLLSIKTIGAFLTFSRIKFFI